MKIGAHVSIAGGLPSGIDRAQRIRAEAIQIFASSPRSWKFHPPTEDQIAEFRQKADELDIGPTFIHGSYLVNIGGNTELVEKSIRSLVSNLDLAARIGATGVIFHGGSHKGQGFEQVFKQATKALREVVSRCPNGVCLAIENSAGMGAHIGSSFSEIGKLVREIDNPNLMVCLDTQHTFAAGYNIADKTGLDRTMEEFDSEIGLSRLVAVHANDSKIELGGGVDRHENIGEGYIGLGGFEIIMAHTAFQNVPFLLEVPGFDPDSRGPDKRNIDRMLELRSRSSLS